MLRSGGGLGRRYGGVYRKAPWWPSYRLPVHFIEPTTAPGNASGSLPTVSVTAPTAVASGGGSPGVASGDLATVTVSAPSAGAAGAAAASGALVTVTISAPAASASGGNAGLASGALPSIGIFAPAAAATGAVSITGALPVVSVSALSGTASVIASPTTTGWRIKVRTAGYRWRFTWRPMTPNTPFPIPIAGANDAGILVEEITGYELPTGVPLIYDGTEITAYWTATPEGTTPIGSITGTYSRNAAKPRFAVAFEAALMTTVLANLPAGSPVWLVLEGANNFRVAIEHVVRSARVLP